MCRDRQLGWATAAGTALVLVLVLAAPASARKYQMNGTWLMRKGQSFIPLQFAGLAVNLSMGSWTEAPFFPAGQVINDTGVVEQNGSAPATLMVRKRSIRYLPGALIPLLGGVPPLIQITSMFSIAAPYSNATLMAGGGPGAFTWCPANAACTLMGTIPGGAPAGNKGRVVYTAGGSQFGGVMRMGLRFGGILSLNVAPGVAGHVHFGGGGPTWRNLAPGGGMNDVPGTEMVFLARGYLTVPPMGIPVQPGVILTPGPFLSTMGGLTITMGGAKLKMPRCCTVGMTMTGGYTTNFGFPHTTGTVLVQQNSVYANVKDFFSIMGSDMRTALGAGNLQTVSGGLAIRVANAGNDTAPIPFRTPYAQFDKVFLDLGPTVPSMSPAGFAAAGALMLLAVGYALRRRIG